ncbi:MAG TPA: hypothetical protein VHC22_13770 [Pirellulales bacterium]|nr:hypothetical protein [Pirellulales bacterium]
MTASVACSLQPTLLTRDERQRRLYADAALAHIPRLLGALDRNPFHKTYGCFDRQYWHYRTASFPSEMYQEAVLPLALIYATPLPGNRWHGEPRLREWAVAALQFAARSSHRDGSCDDYYPFERALGAAVFSLQAATRAYELLQLDEPEIVAWFLRRADWIIDHDESGKLANHHALAALGLARLVRISGDNRLLAAAQERIRTVLAWQSAEGWFEEYGGADPGYQTVTIDALAKLRRLLGDPQLDDPLRRAVDFSRLFLHPDGSYGGEYGSRGTYHFYPHGFELLASQNAAAADLADGFLTALSDGRQAWFDDDRMYAHRLGNLIEAYIDWSPCRPASEIDAGEPTSTYLPHARMVVRRDRETCIIVSAARGGVFKRFAGGERPQTDAGLVVETCDGRQAVSQFHDRCREVTWHEAGELFVSGTLHWTNHETATPIKQAVFHVVMWMLGRWCRTLIRRVLQRRLITGRRACPIRHERHFEFEADGGCRVTDRIMLTDRTIDVRRLAFASDLQACYVAAANVYQESVLEPWTDLGDYVPALNRDRSIVIVRHLPS